MGSKILFVDDEPSWGLMVRTFLRLAGYDVVTAKDAREALLQADASDVGPIILDVNLAGSDTAQLMRSLIERRPESPVVLYTGLDRENVAVQGLLQQGAREYLRKGHLGELVKCLDVLSITSGAAARRPRLAPVGASAWQTV